MWRQGYRTRSQTCSDCYDFIKIRLKSILRLSRHDTILLNSNISQEIFAIDTWKAVKYSLRQSHKRAFAILTTRWRPIPNLLDRKKRYSCTTLIMKQDLLDVVRNFINSNRSLPRRWYTSYKWETEESLQIPCDKTTEINHLDEDLSLSFSLITSRHYFCRTMKLSNT